MREHNYYVYILTNQWNTVLYTGMTNNLVRRMWEHQNNKGSKFTQKYRLKKLVYVEHTTDVHTAIFREKEIKGRNRKKKIQMIESMNPEWRDLTDELAF